MGIGSILLGALKKVPWTSLAMNYGPEIMKKFGDRARPREAELVQEDDTYNLMEEKIRELETIVEEQHNLLTQQQDQLDGLKNTCSGLAREIRIYKTTSILATLAAVVLLIILISR